MRTFYLPKQLEAIRPVIEYYFHWFPAGESPAEDPSYENNNLTPKDWIRENGGVCRFALEHLQELPQTGKPTIGFIFDSGVVKQVPLGNALVYCRNVCVKNSYIVKTSCTDDVMNVICAMIESGHPRHHFREMDLFTSDEWAQFFLLMKELGIEQCSWSDFSS